MPTLAELADKTRSAAELYMTTQRPAGRTATFPLWFVHDGERLYALTADSSSEVWDVRASNRVMVAIGAPDSEDRLPMQADVMEGDEWVSQMVPHCWRRSTAPTTPSAWPAPPPPPTPAATSSSSSSRCKAGRRPRSLRVS